VIFLGGDTIPGAGSALESVEALGARVVFATNNATRTVAEIGERIHGATGYTPSVEAIATSATSTAAALTADDGPVMVVGGSGLTETLEAAELAITDDPTAARSVAVGLDRAIDYGRIDRAAAAIRRGARYIATNTDATFPTPHGPRPGAGAIVAAISTAAGRTPEVTGKPHPPFLRHLRERLGPGSTWVVGDRPETDLALGRAGGWFTVLTLSGITEDPDAVPRHLAPDLIVESVDALANVLAD